MKFLQSGVNSIAETCEVEVAEGVTLRFRALPITWDIDVKAQLPEPPPDNEQSVDRHNRLTSLLMIVDSLEPGQIEFDAVREHYGDLEGYLNAVNKELAAAGFSAKHFQMILSALTELNGYSQAVVEEAEKDFFDLTGS